MRLLKQNKKTDLIEDQTGGIVIILDIRRVVSNQGNPIMFVKFIDDEGQIISDTCKDNPELKPGNGVLSQTKWKKSDKYTNDKPVSKFHNI
jgi:hypothetical protein